MGGSPVVHNAQCRHLNDAQDANSCKQLMDLPHAIILHILSFLPTEDVVRTSVLSRRWEYLWTSIPSPVFREKNFIPIPASGERIKRGRVLFRNFVERALLHRDLSSMKAFSLSCMVDSKECLDGDEFRVNSWITTAILRNVKILHLELEIGHGAPVYMLPHSMFRCETLRELHLLMHHDLKFHSFICLTNLKVLTLAGVRFGDDNSVEKLLACPSLEKLSLEMCSWNLEVLQISAPNLLYLTITEDSRAIQNSQVRIHSALIKSFDYTGDFLYDYILLSSPSLVELSIKVRFVLKCQNEGIGIYRLCKLLKALSNLKLGCLTNLKVLTLEGVRFGDDDSAEKLLSCPSLEKLSLVSCRWNLEVLQISAPNLLDLTIRENEIFYSGSQNSQVHIHGAFVKSFDYYGNFCYDYIVLSSSSLVEASIKVHHPVDSEEIDRLCKLLKALSNAKQLSLHFEICGLKFPSSVCLTNLKVLTLTEVRFGDDNSVEKLLSCPSLEKLSLERCSWNLEVLEISAPNLLYLTIIGSSDYIVLSLPSLVEASIKLYQCLESGSVEIGIYRLCKLLKALSNVKQLSLYFEDTEILDAREDILNSLPVFHSLTELRLGNIWVLETGALWLLLSRCPILKSLTFSEVTTFEEDDWILDPLPPCFTSSLKEIAVCRFSGCDLDLSAVRIFLRTAAVLEKLLLYGLRCRSQTFLEDLIEHLNELPRASNLCTIHCLGDSVWCSIAPALFERL